MKVEEQFLTKSKFTKLIEGTVADMKIPYMDAILHVCNKNNIEPEPQVHQCWVCDSQGELYEYMEPERRVN